MSLLNKLIFNLWYFKKPPWDTNQTPPEIIDFIRTHSPGRALDMGCGTGTNAIWLAQQGWQVVGVDFATKAIRMARRKAAVFGVDVDFIEDDVTKLTELHNPFNLILDIGCYHNLDTKGMEAYRSNINRLLEIGGKFLLYVFFKSRGSIFGSGVVKADLDAFSPPLILISRADGWNRGSRSSTWLTFLKEEV